MNILILMPDARLGGAQNVLLQLADEFRINHTVEFLCLAQSGELQNNALNNIHMRFLVNNDRLCPTALIKALHELMRIMRTGKNTVVLATGTGTNLLACAARVFSPNGARLIIREACSSRNSTNRVVNILKRILYPRADGMIGVSDGVAEELKCLAGSTQPVISIPNPVNANRLRRLAEMPDEALERFPYKYILTVGRLVPQKKTALLIDAFAKSCKKYTEHLVIIGAGPLQQQLQQQIISYGLTERIHLFGEVANPHPWYKRASAFILSSEWEGYPNVILEALGHGLLVISSDCEFGPAQILGNGRYGKLVKVGDVDGMIDAICTTLNGGTEVEAWSPEDFSVSAVAGRYLAFMESCHG